MSNSGNPGADSSFGDHVTAAGGRENRDAEWVAARFGDVGEPPSNDIVVDPNAEPAPNLGDHD